MLKHISDNLSLYTPQPVSLPPDSTLRREQPEGSTSVPTRQKLGTFYGDYEVATKGVQAEYSNIFYDVFRSRNGSKLCAVGPGMLNLAEHLLPLQVHVEGRRLKHKYDERGNYGKLAEYDPIRMGFLQVKLPPELRERSTLKVEFRWKAFTAGVEVPRNPFSGIERAALSLTTIQKNYPAVWLRDWCLYYHRVHGVRRIMLYDNGSDDLKAVLKAVSGLDAGLECVVAEWPFPFGYLSARYSQQGALNHCYQIFGDAVDYHLNFDLDEYLVNLTDKPLAKYLARSLSWHATSALVTQYRVPHIEGEGAGRRHPRAYDFKHRERKPWHYGNRTKTIFRSRNAHFVSNHGVSTRVPRPLRWLFRRSRYAWAIAMRMRFPLPGVYFQKRAHYSELYFAHYVGINTDWKVIRKPKPLDPLTEQPDAVMQRILEQAGLNG